MTKKRVLTALEADHALSDWMLVEEVSLNRQDFLAKNVCSLSRQGLVFFVLANLTVMAIALFRMFYLSRFNLGQVSIRFLYDIGIERHYAIFMLFICACNFWFWHSPALALNDQQTSRLLNKRFQRKFISCVSVATLAWVGIFALYHHKVFLPLNQFESIESGLLVLIPLAYAGGILVIPRYTLMMLFCLIIQQLGSIDMQSSTSVRALVIFLILFGLIFMIRRAVRYVLGLMADIEFKNFRLREKLFCNLNVDPMLLLVSYPKFFEQVNNILSRVKKPEYRSSIMIIDVDYFAAYNEHYGYPQGNHCLQQIAVSLQQCVRHGVDIVGRHGSDAFILFLAEADDTDAAVVATRVREQLAKLQLLHAKSPAAPHVTVSIGSACWGLGASLDEVCRQAANALHQEKHQMLEACVGAGSDH